jgi:uncharacterized RDD family membrane protein YckC
MANQWFYARNNQQTGPVLWDQLQHLAASGMILGTDLIWTEGMASWAPAATIQGLFPPAVPPQSAPGYPPPPGQMPGQVSYNQAWNTAAPGSPFSGVYSTNMAQVAPHGYAGFWIRVLAFIIDALVLGAAFAVVGSVLRIDMSRSMNFSTGPQMPGYWLAAAIGFVYFTVMESSATQATLGKMALGIKVTDLGGNRISYLHAVGRHFARILSEITIGVGYLMVAFTERKQGLHDKVASTLVVYK